MTANKAFGALGLSNAIVNTLTDLGYETPTPVQEQSIPALIEGADLLAQAQTGTGKTAAFALPALMKIDTNLRKPQALIVAPTRELAIQVAEACQAYAKALPDFHVLPVYGGQDYRVQLRALKRGAQIIVGTPGRLMDHMREGKIKTDALKMVVLDEADEMLKMGFIDDVEWILAQIKQPHQTALFSATMPSSVKKISKNYLKDPRNVTIKATQQSVDRIEQLSVAIPNRKKMDVLTRILEVEDVDASIIFVRTRNLSSEVAEKLQARGYSAAPLNGDMNQGMREKVISRIKSGSLDIIVATDVAARGIDVERVSHVFNYDIPHDVEAYIHRIGRTGRAGRSGKAILFVTPREGRLLAAIEKTTKQPIKEFTPPTQSEVHAKRQQELINDVVDHIQLNRKCYEQTVTDIMEKAGCSIEKAAGALAYLLQKRNSPESVKTTKEFVGKDDRPHRQDRKKPWDKKKGGGRGEGRGGKRGDFKGKRSGGHRGKRDGKRSEKADFPPKRRKKK